jgi:2-dehydropantoate 2-reductase
MSSSGDVTRIAILGTGALGCVFAARLARCAEVWVLGTWVAAIDAIRRDGIRIHQRDGSTWQARVQAVSDPAEVPPCNAALLLVKSYQTERAAAWAALILGPDGLAVTFQNGLDNGPKLEAAVGSRRAAIGVNYTGATLIGPGETCHTAQLTNLIGTRPATAARIAAVIDIMVAAGVDTRATDEIEGEVWGKAIANAAINPLTALWRVPNGELLATDERRALLGALVDEAAAVASALGVVLPFADPLAHTAKICQASAPNHSSMLQDIERGRPTEIDSINGIIATEGRRLGVPTPLNEMVWQLIRAMGRAERDTSKVEDAAFVPRP